MLADFFSTLLTGHLFLKRRGTPLTAETIRLPSDYFPHSRTTRHKHAADRILHHLIFAFRQTFLSPSTSELPERASNKEVEDDEENEGKNDPIHSGLAVMEPQSYGRAPGLSIISLGGSGQKSKRFVPSYPGPNGLGLRFFTGLNPLKAQYFRWIGRPFSEC